VWSAECARVLSAGYSHDFLSVKAKKKHESFPNIETLQYLQDESNLFGWLVGYG
jgi:hypothetical protein